MWNLVVVIKNSGVDWSGVFLFGIKNSHLGSGSIAIACHYMGFDLVGCEIDKDYYDEATKRFKLETGQLKLF